MDVEEAFGPIRVPPFARTIPPPLPVWSCPVEDVGPIPAPLLEFAVAVDAGDTVDEEALNAENTEFIVDGHGPGRAGGRETEAVVVALSLLATAA